MLAAMRRASSRVGSLVGKRCDAVIMSGIGGGSARLALEPTFMDRFCCGSPLKLSANRDSPAMR